MAPLAPLAQVSLRFRLGGEIRQRLWTQITDITVDSKIPVKACRLSWQITLHLKGGGAQRLPVPYAVGKEPSAAFGAEYDAIRQRWH